MLGLRSLTALLLGSYLLAWTEIVTLAELLSFGDAVDRRSFLAAQAILTVAAAATWLAANRPLPPWPQVERQALARHKVVVFLLAAAVAATAYQLFIVLATPPNNWDSMVYHLPRAAAWYQRGAVEYYPAHNPIENAYPGNAEIGILYTFVFLGRDAVAAAIQLLAEVSLVVSIYGTARRLGGARGAAAFAALLFPTLSEVALQSVTTQNDLVVASFVAAAAYFLVGRGHAELLPAGLAIGLAVGTKLTALFALPLLVLLALAAVPRRRLPALAAYALVGITLVGAQSYVRNLVETRTCSAELRKRPRCDRPSSPRSRRRPSPASSTASSTSLATTRRAR